MQELDQLYTQHGIAKRCVSYALPILTRLAGKRPFFIEPSAGDGVFYNLLPAERKFNASTMSGQAYGFAVYSRKVFGQKKQHSRNAIINFFDNPHRGDLEKRVIASVKCKHSA